MSETTNQPNEDVTVARKPVAIAGESEADHEMSLSPQADAAVTRKPVSLEGRRDGQDAARSPKNDRDLETEIADAPIATPEVVRKPVVIGDALKDEKDGNRNPKNTG